MNALLILIPITLVLVIVAVGIFFWAVNHAQFEDLDTPKILPLLDDAPQIESRGQSALSERARE
jgi:cbb3-type cytochrome oxidase maturation protein